MSKSLKRISFTLVLALLVSVFASLTATAAGGTSDTQKPSPEIATANPTTLKLYADGIKISTEAYNIKDNNYFKLRDIAAAINGTEKNFEVGWNSTKNAINLESGKQYTLSPPQNQELTEDVENKTPKKAIATNSKLYLDGKEVQLSAYNIAGQNYYKLRDLGKAINFGVRWDDKANIISVDTNSSYTEVQSTVTSNKEIGPQKETAGNSGGAGYPTPDELIAKTKVIFKQYGAQYRYDHTLVLNGKNIHIALPGLSPNVNGAIYEYGPNIRYYQEVKYSSASVKVNGFLNDTPVNKESDAFAVLFIDSSSKTELGYPWDLFVQWLNEMGITLDSNFKDKFNSFTAEQYAIKEAIDRGEKSSLGEMKITDGNIMMKINLNFAMQPYFLVELYYIK